MLKNKFKVTLILFAILVLISSFSFATETNADDILQNPDASLEEILSAYEDYDSDESEEVYSTNNNISENWINDDLYKIEEKVEINQIVDGNVYVMAKEVVIDSEIGGNVYVMAEKITVGENAYIYSNLYALGKNISINGIICDAYLAADNISVGSDGYIYRDLRATGNVVNLAGKIRRNAYLSVNELIINSENKEESIETNQENIDKTIIGGNLTYSSKTEANIPEGAVNGETIYNQEIENVKQVSIASVIRTYVFDAITALIYIAVVVLLSVYFAPKFVEKVKNTETKNALLSLAIGFGTPIAGVISVILLLITGVAAKVGLALLMLLVLVGISGTAITSIYLGNIVAKKLKFEEKPKFVLACLLVALAIWIIAKIPFIGGFVDFVASILGIGLFVFNIFNRKINKKNPEEKIEVNETEPKE